MKIRHKGHISDIFDLPGSGAQGTNIGILSFLCYVNSCGVPFNQMMKCFEHDHKEKYIGFPVEENQEVPPQNLGWTQICHPILPEPIQHISDLEARISAYHKWNVPTP